MSRQTNWRVERDSVTGYTMWVNRLTNERRFDEPAEVSGPAIGTEEPDTEPIVHAKPPPTVPRTTVGGDVLTSNPVAALATTDPAAQERLRRLEAARAKQQSRSDSATERPAPLIEPPIALDQDPFARPPAHPTDTWRGPETEAHVSPLLVHLSTSPPKDPIQKRPGAAGAVAAMIHPPPGVQTASDWSGFVAREGYLHKRTRGRWAITQTWQKRYFLLTAKAGLMYFQTQQAREVAGNPPLAQLDLRCALSAEHQGRMIVLGLDGAGEYRLRAETEREAQQWFHAIIHALWEAGHRGAPGSRLWEIIREQMGSANKPAAGGSRSSPVRSPAAKSPTGTLRSRALPAWMNSSSPTKELVSPAPKEVGSRPASPASRGQRESPFPHPTPESKTDDTPRRAFPLNRSAASSPDVLARARALLAKGPASMRENPVIEAEEEEEEAADDDDVHTIPTDSVAVQSWARRALMRLGTAPPAFREQAPPPGVSAKRVLVSSSSPSQGRGPSSQGVGDEVRTRRDERIRRIQEAALSAQQTAQAVADRHPSSNVFTSVANTDGSRASTPPKPLPGLSSRAQWASDESHDSEEDDDRHLSQPVDAHSHLGIDESRVHTPTAHRHGSVQEANRLIASAIEALRAAGIKAAPSQLPPDSATLRRFRAVLSARVGRNAKLLARYRSVLEGAAGPWPGDAEKPGSPVKSPPQQPEVLKSPVHVQPGGPSQTTPDAISALGSGDLARAAAVVLQRLRVSPGLCLRLISSARASAAASRPAMMEVLHRVSASFESLDAPRFVVDAIARLIVQGLLHPAVCESGRLASLMAVTSRAYVRAGAMDWMSPSSAREPSSSVEASLSLLETGLGGEVDPWSVWEGSNLGAFARALQNREDIRDVHVSVIQPHIEHIFDGVVISFKGGDELMGETSPDELDIASMPIAEVSVLAEAAFSVLHAVSESSIVTASPTDALLAIAAIESEAGASTAAAFWFEAFVLPVLRKCSRSRPTPQERYVTARVTAFLHRSVVGGVPELSTSAPQPSKRNPLELSAEELSREASLRRQESQHVKAVTALSRLSGHCEELASSLADAASDSVGRSMDLTARIQNRVAAGVLERWLVASPASLAIVAAAMRAGLASGRPPRVGLFDDASPAAARVLSEGFSPDVLDSFGPPASLHWHFALDIESVMSQAPEGLDASPGLPTLTTASARACHAPPSSYPQELADSLRLRSSRHGKASHLKFSPGSGLGSPVTPGMLLGSKPEGVDSVDMWLGVTPEIEHAADDARLNLLSLLGLWEAWHDADIDDADRRRISGSVISAAQAASGVAALAGALVLQRTALEALQLRADERANTLLRTLSTSGTPRPDSHAASHSAARLRIPSSPAAMWRAAAVQSPPHSERPMGARLASSRVASRTASSENGNGVTLGSLMSTTFNILHQATPVK
jgi:hypothetical protein